MADPADVLCWLDMEMTGLDPHTCVPLQIAVVVTSAGLDELESVEITIRASESALEGMEDFVRRMHTGNGLLEAVRAATTDLADADRAVAELLGRWCGAGQAVLAGNSIHQDRRFLEAYFPLVSARLHYRMVDVSSLKELVRRWYGPAGLFNKGGSRHTALADVRDSIEELRFYRAHYFSRPGPDPTA